MGCPNAKLDPSLYFLKFFAEIDLTLLYAWLRINISSLPSFYLSQFPCVEPNSISPSLPFINTVASKIYVWLKQLFVLVDLLEANDIPKLLIICILLEKFLAKQFFSVLPSQQARINSIENCTITLTYTCELLCEDIPSEHANWTTLLIWILGKGDFIKPLACQ